ncbi:unnamed protein product [Phytophthora lilii]|uniref:Unnamed protein product n=1 Tax=Phytophthora lilii TaxID=2077276 RepID=A0A9W6WMT5_9STRA|nr:unnamed protein product [Phytophthora lilii]
MRTCKALHELGDKKARGCFSSVGSAAHSFHGDDAVGFGPGYMVVSDGVSGTMKASGVLARMLVAETLTALAKLRKRAREAPPCAEDFLQSMQAAIKSARKLAKRKGRLDATISAVFFDEASRQMFVYTIGDCKCVVFRGGELVFESDSIIYDFNVPAVVSSNQAINYAAEVQIQTFEYEAGDTCLLFSDGVHDNLYVDDIASCVASAASLPSARSKGGAAEEIARRTVQRAKDTFTCNTRYIPFAVSAAGFCREALTELEANKTVDSEEFERFRQKCEAIPSLDVKRAAFAKERRVRQLAFYSASNLLAFAHKKQGKRDDISVCAAQDFKFDGLVVDDEPVEPISPMPWYPDNRGFTWSVERRRVRKLPILKEFQSWLVELSNSGSITRQEAVSMIPPLVLGVEPHHKVLDMCAAPGSKTSQLLESLHSQEFATGKTPTGVVVANDVDLKRAYMLVHQSKRISSPALLVTCHEAQNIPFLGTDGTESEGVFDRILCDAPCSGDGTLRKNPLIWKNWSAKNGIALHPLQLQIAKRGAALLKVGGNMCYSTCTFNPLENEAVVANLLRWSNGSLELVDVSNTLPLLKRRPGISTWKVLDSKLTEFASYEDYVTENMKEKIKDKIRATMFPPTTEEAADLHLERCMRCLPQDENTGGFFICLLKKVAPTPNDKEEDTSDKSSDADVKTEDSVEKTDAVVTSEDAVEKTEVTVPSSDAAPSDAKVKTEAASDEAATEETKPRRNRRDDRRNKKGEVYVAFGADNWENVREYYDVAPAFSASQLITRSEDAKSVTFVTESITMALLEEMKRKKLKVVYAGLKMFERNETKEGGKVYRVCQAGLPHILPFMNQRKVKVSTKDFQMMLERLDDLLDFDEFEPAARKYFEDAPIANACAVPIFNRLKVMNLVVWRGRNSVNVMAAKADVAVLLGTMKEMKIYNAAVQEAVQEAKKAKDAERAVRDEKKQEEEKVAENEASKTKEEADATPAV